MTNYILYISQIELLKLWGELVECYHGVNGFGGYDVEIYAYRLMPDSPMTTEVLANKELLSKPTYREAYQESVSQAANALADLCVLFQEVYNCHVAIEGLSPDKFRKVTFEHRAVVSVSKIERGK